MALYSLLHGDNWRWCGLANKAEALLNYGQCSHCVGVVTFDQTDKSSSFRSEIINHLVIYLE